jgi:hypothetical protein
VERLELERAERSVSNALDISVVSYLHSFSFLHLIEWGQGCYFAN